jgi:hypothetical protein
MTNETTVRDCKGCKGTKIYQAWNGPKDCPYCKGTGVFQEPDYQGILTALTATKGKNKGGIKVSAPKYDYWDSMSVRVYHVWRMWRFDTGQDVTMPITSFTNMRHDPWSRELEQMAEMLARKTHGARVSAGALRWGPLLGACPEDAAQKLQDAGHIVPPSAFSCGPVADEHKPVEESLELR